MKSPVKSSFLPILWLLSVEADSFLQQVKEGNPFSPPRGRHPEAITSSSDPSTTTSCHPLLDPPPPHLHFTPSPGAARQPCRGCLPQPLLSRISGELNTINWPGTQKLGLLVQHYPHSRILEPPSFTRWWHRPVYAFDPIGQLLKRVNQKI